MGNHRLFSRINKQEAACAVCVFALSLVKAGLTEKSRLLVPCGACDFNWSSENVAYRFTVNAAGRLWLRQHAFWNIKQFQYFIIPFQGVYVEHHSSGSIGVVGDMNLSVGKLPDEPCLYGAEKKLSCRSLFPGALHIVKYPLQLGAAEICIEKQAGLFPYHFAKALCFQLVAVLCRPSALPHDGIAYRNSCLLVPDHRGFTLVGYSDSFYIFVCTVYLQQSLLSYTHLRRPYFHGIMLHPAGLRVYLSEFLLCHAHHISLFIVDNAAGAGGSLVQSHYVLAHISSSFFMRAHRACTLIQTGP